MNYHSTERSCFIVRKGCIGVFMIVLLVVVINIIMIAQTVAQSDTLTSDGIIQVQVISRHCDRLPISSLTIPNNPVDFPKVSDLNLGDLTGLGQHQCNQLGDSLYDRYISSHSKLKVKGIASHY